MLFRSDEVLSAQSQTFGAKMAVSAAKEQVHVFDKHTENIFLTNIKNIAVEREYYDLTFEDAAASLEPALPTLESNTYEFTNAC